MAFRVLTTLFFMWGFITVMNDVLNNTVDDIFHLDNSPVKRALVQFTFFTAFFIVSLTYFLISIRKGDPINRIGYNRGMIISLLICAAGCAGFYPAALSGAYPAFLGSLFVLATGVTLLQICANPYAAIMGPPETASSRLNLAQGLNSLGTTMAPVVGLLLIYRVFSHGTPTVSSIATSYLIFAAIFVLLALAVAWFKLPPYRNDEQLAGDTGVLRYPHLVWGIVAIFFYVGSEVSVGNWLVDFLLDPGVSDLSGGKAPTPASRELAGHYLSYFWGGLMIGRVLANYAFDLSISATKRAIYMLFSAIGLFAVIYLITSIHYSDGIFTFDFISSTEVAIYFALIAAQFVGFYLGRNNAARSLVIFSLINLALIVLSMAMGGKIAFWAMIGTGLFFSIGWSNIFTLAIRGLGKYTSQGSSLLVMAIVGGAVLPMVQANLYKHTELGIRYSFIVPAMAMLYLAWYGWKGHK
jgi:MFS transporter, FHS family, L-fucose permease